jgi:gliding motility-associated-like protein
MVSTANNQQFTTLPKGVYTVTATTVCKSSGAAVTKTTAATITSTYTEMVAFINDFRKPLACNSLNTGMISVYILEGRAPYAVKITSAPAAYSGNTEFVQNTSGAIVFNDLPAGSYSFSITDNCLYDIPLSINLLPVASNFPTDPFYQNTISLGKPPDDCNRVIIRKNSISGELAYYWNQLRSQYYEMSFSINGIDSDWMPAGSSVDEAVILPRTIKEIRENGYVVKAKLRLKDCPDQVQEVDIIDIPEPSVSSSLAGIDCDAFKYSFLINNVCLPYNWEIHEDVSGISAGSGTVSEADTYADIILDLNKDYTLTVTDNDGYQLVRHILRSQKDLYTVYYSRQFCLPDTFSVYYYLAMYGNTIPAGTRIEQTSGPTMINPDVTLDEDTPRYYMFSSDYENMEHVRIEDGTYSFEITTVCGEIFTKTFTHRGYGIRDFGYVAEEACDGLRVFPTGEFYQDNIPQGAYYKMTTAPSGVDIGSYQFHSSETDPAGKTGKYFLLPKTGQYVFQISLSTDYCPSNTIAIEYEQKNFALDNRSVYTCSSGGMPNFRLSAQNGIAPYTYELLENGTVVASNGTGDFIYGHPSNTYGVRVTDDCGKNFTTDLQVIDIFNDALVSGTGKVCVGGAISLSCMSLGASGFQWTGPSGFSSAEQSISISNVTTDNAGTYTVTIQPYGCSDPVSRDFDVEVYIPPVPPAPDTVMFCVNAASTFPAIAPLANHSLVWYAGDGITECPAPEVNTDVAHEEVYFVAQKDNALGCEGDKHKILVIVNPPPSSEIPADAPVICSGDAPVIEIRNTGSGFIYDIYADFGRTNTIVGAINGTNGDVSITLPVTLLRDTVYYISVTDSLGCVSLSPKALNITVRQLFILPESLPPYRKNTEYEQMLTSNAESPNFSMAEGNLPGGLTLYSTGHLRGVVPGSEGNAVAVFTVKVEDPDGCTAFRDYTLEGNIIATKAFSPNNDGINDVFMAGYKVVIFDRLGIIIFEGADGWDGTYNGKTAPSDIYFYKLFYEENGITKIKTGYVGIVGK